MVIKRSCMNQIRVEKIASMSSKRLGKLGDFNNLEEAMRTIRTIDSVAMGPRLQPGFTDQYIVHGKERRYWLFPIEDALRQHLTA